ncbi:MAG: amidohydrolase family protein [Proteobacteria bacterium]|nr:amidohydrolase family protein [Pseudomonadota bacterium]
MDPKFRVCMPPDPNPAAPKFKAPAGACDTHCHIFGPPHAFPYSEQRRYTAPAAPVEHYLLMLDAIGVERGIVVQPNVHATDNRVSLHAIATGGGRLRGVGRIDDGTSDRELADMDAGGIRGIRFEFVRGRPGSSDLELFSRMIDRIRPLGWHVELHVDPDIFVELEPWFRALDVVCVVDHFARIQTGDGIGQPGFKLLLDLMRRDNYWTKISGGDERTASPWPYAEIMPFAHALIDVAPDRLMWGTNWPHSNIFVLGQTPNDGRLLDLMLDYAPDEAIRNKILVDNPARLFGFAD